MKRTRSASRKCARYSARSKAKLKKEFQGRLHEGNGKARGGGSFVCDGRGCGGPGAGAGLGDAREKLVGARAVSRRRQARRTRHGHGRIREGGGVRGKRIS